MPWIELHTNLRHHLKLSRFAFALKLTKAQAAGHLSFLWLWALEYRPSGNFGRAGDSEALQSAEIAEAADYTTGDSKAFVAALRTAGLLDADGTLHDWHDYAGRYLAQREADKLRKRAERDARNRPPDQPPALSGGCPADVRRMSGPTIPDQTEPNQTSPKRLTDERARVPAALPTTGDNRSSLHRSQESDLMERLASFLGKDEMARAGGHWRVNHARKHPALLERAIADLEHRVKTGEEAKTTRGAWLEDLVKRWK